MSYHARYRRSKLLDNWLIYSVSQFSGICVGVRAGTFNIVSERLARNVRKDFYDSIVDKDIAFYDVNRTGELGKYQFVQIQIFLAVKGCNLHFLNSQQIEL